MAEIRKFWVARHLRAEPTSWIACFKNGRQRCAGRGLAFWFLPLGTSLVEVPMDDRELPFLLAGRSADFQDVHVNGVVTYRVAEPELVAERVDFSIDPATGRFRGEPLDKLAVIVRELAQELAGAWVARASLRALLDAGIDVVRDEIQRGLTAAPGIAALGLEIVATRVASVKPTAEMEKALQMPTRERIQQEADEAIFRRRALAVEKERAIAENELANRIELARREKQLISEEAENSRSRATGLAEAQQIEAAAEAERTRTVESARAEAEQARIAIYRDLPPAVLLGLAARELAGKLDTIEHVNITPDLLAAFAAEFRKPGLPPIEG